MFIDTFGALCKQKGVTMNKACLEMGISRTATAKWKNGSIPNGQTLSIIADYFDVPVGFLLGEEPKNAPALTEKDRRDIAKDIEDLMAKLDSHDTLEFDGDPMSDEARASIRAAMQLGLEAAKVKNKERFTPKKFKKG